MRRRWRDHEFYEECVFTGCPVCGGTNWKTNPYSGISCPMSVVGPDNGSQWAAECRCGKAIDMWELAGNPLLWAAYCREFQKQNGFIPHNSVTG